MAETGVRMRNDGGSVAKEKTKEDELWKRRRVGGCWWRIRGIVAIVRMTDPWNDNASRLRRNLPQGSEH